jgi:Protein of unknown function (DUF1360)
MHLYNFLLGTLFVWRITHMLSAEDGPWDIVVRLRRAVGEGFLGQLLDCFYCLSLWISAPLAVFLGEKLGERILLWPALSAAAILLERVTHQREGESPAVFVEESEDENVMLWREKSSAHKQNRNSPDA